jgi:hypothetical protein
MKKGSPAFRVRQLNHELANSTPFQVVDNLMTCSRHSSSSIIGFELSLLMRMPICRRPAKRRINQLEETNLSSSPPVRWKVSVAAWLPRPQADSVSAAAYFRANRSRLDLGESEALIGC